MNYDRIVSDAEARRKGLLTELAALDKFIASARELARFMRSHSPDESDETQSKPRSRGGVTNPTKEAVSRILRDRGCPMKTSVLLPLVLKSGVDVGGKDPVATLSARLSNADEFVNDRSVGWWFSDEPLPSQATIFEEPEAESLAGTPASGSNHNEGGSEDAAALVADPARW